ncbi:MAG: TetR/AcrR family transcriptional regulator [Aeromicrobium sp.]
MNATPVALDRAAAVRRALLSLVARDGFHGTSMAAVAKQAEVATGTAYVHYASKEELVYATYLEVKRDLGQAAIAHVDPTASSRAKFEQVWHGVRDHLTQDPDRARFLVQVDCSPFALTAHDRAMTTDGDPLMTSPIVLALLEEFVPLPAPLLLDLAIGPIIRLTASGTELDARMASTLVESCWQAVSR